MRLHLIALALLTMVAIAGCSSQANVDTGAGATAVTPLSAPTVVDAASPIPPISPNPAATRTPRAPAATKTSGATPTPLEIDAQLLPLPSDAKETKNIPAVARSFVQNQLKGQSRIGQPHAYAVEASRAETVAAFRQQLSASGWEAIPIGGLRDPIDVLFAQKANVRTTIVFATQDNGETLIYLIATRP